MDTQTQFRGLSNELVSKSRLENGSNILTPPKKTPVWRLFLEKFKDPIIRILLIALILSFLVACYQYFTGIESGNVFLEPAGILLAVLLATGVGFLFERSANKKFDILNQINDETAVRVIRNARVVEVGRQDIVVGDIILLETGDEVPADATLLDAVSLQINESSLTGEPSIGKTTNPSQFDKDSTYPSNEVLRGTTVIDGHAVAEVIRVGDATEYGKVYTGSQIENQVETPLNKQLKRLSKLITYASYLVATLIIVGRLIMYFSLHEAPLDWLQLGGFLLNTLMIAVTVIVVTVPEGLPMSVTLSLALSMKRMLSANNLVRKMHACETMGACTVICTDKTGTLTQNQMTVYETVFYALGDIPEKKLELKADDLSRIIKENIAVNTTAFLEKTDPMHLKVLGNPTEGALLLWLNAQGEHYEIIRSSAKMVEQLTFSTERKYMATVVDSFLHPGKRLLFVKGAPEIVLSLCKEIIVDGKEVPAEEYSAHIDQQLADYQAKAMRTLGFAYAEIDKDQEISCFENGQLRKNLPLKYLGIVAISDPVRSDVPEAIQSCLDAGIDIKIVTGDTPGTATEIARQIKLWKEEYTEENRITGPEFGLLSEEELEERVLKLKIISRARPMDKERLVKALQRKGQVVAVTGDGTNDAPALNAAQVGLSMGDGTSVAKEASDITILDNSFTSINRAVMWGRSLYQNVQRFILFQMTINVAACLTVLIGAFLGSESPLTVTQMLWVNLIMDTFAAMALASLPPNEEVMKDKPRKEKEHIIQPTMTRRILSVGFLFVVVLFGLMQYFKYEDISSLKDFDWNLFVQDFFRFSKDGHGFSLYEKSLFFTFFVMFQFWNMFNAKAYKTHGSAFKGIKDCLDGFVLVGLLIVVGQIIIVNYGGQMFSVAPLSLSDWIIITLVSSLVLWIGEIIRFLTPKKSKTI